MRRVSATESLGILTTPTYSAHHTHLQGMDAWCFPLRSPNGGVGIEIILVVSSVVVVDVVFVFLLKSDGLVSDRADGVDHPTASLPGRVNVPSSFPSSHPIPSPGKKTLFRSSHPTMNGSEVPLMAPHFKMMSGILVCHAGRLDGVC
jgi:hypothetical protein